MGKLFEKLAAKAIMSAVEKLEENIPDDTDDEYDPDDYGEEKTDDEIFEENRGIPEGTCPYCRKGTMHLENGFYECDHCIMGMTERDFVLSCFGRLEDNFQADYKSLYKSTKKRRK